MFRNVTRVRQQLTQEECVRLLTEEKRGVLSVRGDDDYPYGVPLNHYYDPEDGHLYFHSGPNGHKIDAIRQWDKASFCVIDSGSSAEGEWALRFRSVIVFGRVRIVEDHEKALSISRKLSLKFTDDMNYIEQEIIKSGPRVLCFELIPEWITGKRIVES